MGCRDSGKVSDKPIVESRKMLHYSKQHTFVRIARLMMDLGKRDKIRYVFGILPKFSEFVIEIKIFSTYRKKKSNFAF